MKRALLAVGFGFLLLVGISGPVRGQSGPPPLPTFGPIPPPPPPPGVGTATPTPTPTATPTATPVPLTLTVHVAHGTVKAGQKQKITVDTLAGASVHIAVKFPNGHKLTKNGTANGNGVFSWSFKQPSGTTTSKSHTAKVSIKVSLASQTPLTKNRTYRIG
ncbi:MAG TPA: hypothetical protein VKX16_04850 [Chloroflexota bacterium]|nr:hypothetical protein [Chloroflexota bacterium]